MSGQLTPMVTPPIPEGGVVHAKAVATVVRWLERRRLRKRACVDDLARAQRQPPSASDRESDAIAPEAWYALALASDGRAPPLASRVSPAAPSRHGHVPGWRLSGWYTSQVQPFDCEDVVPEDVDEGAPPDVLDRQLEHQVVGLRVREACRDGSALRQQRQVFGGCRARWGSVCAGSYTRS